MQYRLCYYQQSIRFVQVSVRRLSSLNGEKSISSQNTSEDQRAKWYQNGFNRPLLSNTKTFKKRNIFLM
jgi:hypothetical protein